MPPPTPRPRAPTATTTAAPSPAPTMMCRVPPGQWKKSQALSRRSCSSTIEHALAGQDEKPLLRVLTVVHAHRLTGLENADVDPELREPPLAFEGAVGTEQPFVLPTRLTGVHDEPALTVDDEAVPRHPQRSLGNHAQSLPDRPPVTKRGREVPRTSGRVPARWRDARATVAGPTSGGRTSELDLGR